MYPAQQAETRIGDVERERVVEALKTAYAANRLDPEELDSRLQLALTARTHRDLAVVTAGLEPEGRPVPVAAARVTGKERLIAGGAHATAFVPIVLLPAWIMCTTGRRSAYVRHHAAEAVNFQLTLLLVTLVTFGLGSILYAVAWAVGLVAAAVALTGNPCRYPLVLRVFGR